MRYETDRTPVGIRIYKELLYEAKLAAVKERVTLGRWLESAIIDKINKTRRGSGK